MEPRLTEEQAYRHDALAEQGAALIEGELLLEGAMPGSKKPGWLARRRLRKAIRFFEQAVEINPENWSLMWTMGKVCQRLEDWERSLHWFERAREIKPDQPDVAREAGIAAIMVGRGELAISYCRASVEANPDDAGLIANLALAHLIAGDVDNAGACAGKAVARNPTDRLSVSIAAIIMEIQSGKYPAPKSMHEFQRLYDTVFG